MHRFVRRTRLFSTSALLTLVLFAMNNSAQAAENWPAWRGIDGTGVVPADNLPTTWGPDHENIRWRTPLPESGNSTPIIWENRVFITQPLEKEKRRTLMCFDRNDGKLLWQQGVVYDQEDPSHATNPYCSPSPVTDGERVVVWFGSAGLYCYDLEGNELWRRDDLGPQDHKWGTGTSPVFYKDLCILQFGPGTSEFVLAVDKTSGSTKWKIDALDAEAEAKLIVEGTLGGAGKSAEADKEKTRAEQLRGSWGTPIIVRAKANGAMRDELILNQPYRVTSRDPATGEELWICRGLGPLVYSSPGYGENTIVAMGGYFGGSIAVTPGGSGDVSDSHRVWFKKKSKARLGTGVIKDGYYYVTDMNGVAQCLELATGKFAWEARLDPAGSNGGIWSSPVLAGDLVYITNKSGDSFVYRTNPEEFELISRNSLEETSNSSVAVAGETLFLRTDKALYCVGKPE